MYQLANTILTGEIVQVTMDNFYPFPDDKDDKEVFASKAAIWLYHFDASTKVILIYLLNICYYHLQFYFGFVTGGWTMFFYHHYGAYICCYDFNINHYDSSNNHHDYNNNYYDLF